MLERKLFYGSHSNKPSCAIKSMILPITIAVLIGRVTKTPSTHFTCLVSRTDVKIGRSDQPSSQFAFDFNAWETTAVPNDGCMFTSDGTMW